MDKLQDFSETCLSTLKQKLNKKDEDIAGIPLQCMLIAEIYMPEAHRFSDSKNKRFKHCTEAASSIDINSITDLYEKMISHKIGKFIATYPLVPELINCILPWHMYLALELIFPSHAHEFKDTLQVGPRITPDYLVNIGILEQKGSSREDPARFIHRTFAEYLAARYFVKYVITDRSTGLQNTIRESPNFLFENLLECSIEKSHSRTYYKCAFKYSVLCHFLDALLDSQTHISIGNCINLKLTKFIKDVLYACVHSDFGSIMRFVRSLKYPEGFSIDSILYHDTNILIDAMTLASLDLLRFLLQSFEHEPLKLINQTDHTARTVIHAAMVRGSYTIFEYLFKEHDFENLVKENSNFLDLVHYAVRDTVDGDQGEIQDRVQILAALCDLKKEMVNFTTSIGESPLLAHRVNIELLKALIACGANLFHFDQSNSTFLHKAACYLCSTDYYDLLQFTSNTNLNSVLQMHNSVGHLSLHLIVKYGLATPDILDFILSNGIDINTGGREGHTSIFYALEMGKEEMTIPTMKLLLEKGADHTIVCSNGDSILHYSVEVGRIDCLRFFLEEKNMNINEINNLGNTPIFTAVSSWSLGTVEFLLEQGADYKILNLNNSNLLHYSAKCRQLECIRLFLGLDGLDINQVDNDGHTPLLCAVSLHDEYDDYEHTVEIVELLLNKGADHTISNKDGNNILHILAEGEIAKGFSHFDGLASVDVNAKNYNNNTPLHLVFKNIHNYDSDSLLHCTEQLLSFGANVYAMNNDRKTPVDIYQREKLNQKCKEKVLKNDLPICRLLEGSRLESHPDDDNVC